MFDAKESSLSEVFGGKAAGVRLPTPEEREERGIKREDFKRRIVGNNDSFKEQSWNDRIFGSNWNKKTKVNNMIPQMKGIGIKDMIPESTGTGFKDMMPNIKSSGSTSPSLTKGKGTGFKNIMADIKLSGNMSLSSAKGKGRKKLVPSLGRSNFKAMFPRMGNNKVNFNAMVPQMNFKSIASKPEQRIKQQAGLSMFGDFDGDGVVNILDCDPRNRLRQGIATKIKNWTAGRGYVEDDEVPLQTPSGELQKYTESSEQQQSPIIKYGDEDDEKESALQKVSGYIGVGAQKVGTYLGEVGEGAKEVGGYIGVGAKKVGGYVGAGATGIAKGVSNVYQATGIQEAREDRDKQKEFEKEIRGKALEEALKDKTKAEAKSLYIQTYKKERGIRPTPIQAIRGHRSEFKGAGAGVRQAVSPFAIGGVGVGSQSQKVSNLIGLRSNLGVSSAMQLAGGYRQSDPFAIKVDDAVGKGELRAIMASQPIAQPIQQYPTAPAPSYQPAPGPSIPKGSPPEPGMQWSPHSKRWVRYPRGPYKKTMVYRPQ